MNKHGVSRGWITEADVKHFKSGALRTITNITKSMINWKKISKILFIGTEQLSEVQILRISWILLTDSELPTIKMALFDIIFQKCC